jgi:hypothetical protein
VLTYPSVLIFLSVLTNLLVLAYLSVLTNFVCADHSVWAD